MSKDTHKLMLEHSQAKIHLYGSYLAKYLRVISQDKHTTDIHLYDLFCGEGIYEDGGKGSPIIALEKIRSCYSDLNGKMPNMKVTFNDIDKNVIFKLKESLKKEHVSTNCDIKILTENYLNLLPSINAKLNAIRKEKAVIFLDPKGYKEICIADISRLLSSGKSEVLVFLPIRDMHRFSNMQAEEINSAHEPLFKFITEVFKNKIPKFESQLDFIRKTKEGLKKILPEYFIDTFTLEREKGQFFCLFFFTSHIYGFEKMLETKWEIDQEEGRMLRYEKSGIMFSGTETLNYPQKLKDFLMEKRRYNGDVYSFSLHEGFLPSHTNDILRDWQEKQNLIVFTPDGKEGRKNAYYISYREENKKIFFKYNPSLF